jgi:hypothetical protein
MTNELNNEPTGSVKWTFYLTESEFCIPEHWETMWESLSVDRKEELLSLVLEKALLRGGDEAAHEQFYYYFSDGAEEFLLGQLEPEEIDLIEERAD